MGFNYYKDELNNLFALTDDGLQDDFIQDNFIPISLDEANIIRLSKLEISTPEQLRERMPSLNRVQFKTLLIKHNLWEQAQTLAASLGIEAQIKLSDGQIFERMDDTLNMMAGKLALSDDQVDALFTEGYTY